MAISTNALRCCFRKLFIIRGIASFLHANDFILNLKSLDPMTFSIYGENPEFFNRSEAKTTAFTSLRNALNRLNFSW